MHLFQACAAKSVRFSLAEDGTLKIQRVHAEKTECPWKSYSSHIKKVIIYKGVTTICQGAFECNYLDQRIASWHIVSIGTAVFGVLRPYKKIVIPKSVTDW